MELRLRIFVSNIIHRRNIIMSSDSVVYHYLAIGKLGRGEVVK